MTLVAGKVCNKIMSVCRGGGGGGGGDGGGDGGGGGGRGGAKIRLENVELF